MPHAPAPMVVPLLVVSFAGCNAYVERARYDALQNESAAVKKQLEDVQDELKKAREEAAHTRPGRYQFSRQGLREWRFDTATGSSCVQLTAGADWKDPEIRSQSCVCEDERNGLFAATTDQGRKTFVDVMDHSGCYDYANKLMGQPTSGKNVAPPK